MSITKWLFHLFLTVLVSGKSFGTVPTPPNFDDPSTIFQFLSSADDLPEITIVTDVGQLLENRKTQNLQVAKLALGNGKSTLSFEVSLQVSGTFRRRVCDFPPLSLQFKEEDLAMRGFGVYNKLMLVTHCLDGKLSGNGNVLKEFLAYRIYEVLSPNAYRARLVRLNYIDQKGSQKKMKRYGILIESRAEMAARLGGTPCECYNVPDSSVSPEEENKMALFQYLIGNEDWHLPAVRNVDLLRKADDKVIPIPYNFDFSGLVNASYAVPSPDLQLRSVTDRHFMGFTPDPKILVRTIALFQEKKTTIYNLVRELKQLESAERERILAYFDAFYRELPSVDFLPQSIDIYHQRLN